MKHSARVALLLVVVAASTRARPSEATRDAPPARRDAPREPAPMCTARLVVRQTRGAAGCFLDERVTGAPGSLRYPCGGGAATAAFRNGTFAGRVDARGAVSLALRTRFHFSDGCDWQSTQSISGALDGALTYQYAEAPLPGQRGCAPSCRADGAVEVQR